MNATEFEAWAQAFGGCFPDTRDWWLKNKQWKETMESWKDILSDVSLPDALAATRAIARGDEEPIAAYERELIPTRIRAISKRYEAQRASDQHNRRVLNQGRRQPATVIGSAAAAYLAGREAHERGESAEGVKAAITKMLDASAAEPSYRDAYHCHICKDTGFRRTWGAKAISDVNRGAFDRERPDKYNTGVACCDRCERGRKQAARQNQKTGRPIYPAFDAARHAGYFGTSEQQVADFLEWCATPANYEKSFDAFNRGEPATA